MAFTDYLQVPLVDGPIASQRAVGQVLLNAETAHCGVYMFGDSRLTAPAGAGLDRVSALAMLLPELTKHRNLPFTPFCPPLTYTAIRSPFLMANNSNALNTGLATTVARELPNHDPSNTGANGILRAPVFSPPGAIWFGFDPEARDVNPVVGMRGLTRWNRANNFRGRVFVSSNPVTTTDLFLYVLGKPDRVVNETGATVRQTLTISGVNALLETPTYLVTSYTNNYLSANTDEFFIVKANCSDIDGIEVLGCWIESVDPKGIGLVTIGAGSTRIESMAALHPNCDLLLKHMHATKPCSLIVLAFDVNDALNHTAAAWQTFLSDGIDFHRAQLGVGTDVPVIVWIAHEPVFGEVGSELTYETEWRQFAGVAKAVADLKTNVVVVNTATNVCHWFDPKVNWVADGVYVGNLVLVGSFAANSVVKWTNDAAVPNRDPLGDNHWYFVKTTTVAGETPGTAAAKFLTLDLAYDPLKANYERHHGVAYAGRAYVHQGIVASAAGQEPGVHANWVESTLYSPVERVHPNANGSRIIVEEFLKACAEMIGNVSGYALGNSDGYTQGNTDGYNTGYAAGIAAGGAGGGEGMLGVPMASQTWLAGTGRYMEFTPNLTVPAGAVIVVGQFIGIATSGLQANRVGAVKMGGCDWFDQDPGAKTVGTVVYLEAAQEYQRVTVTPTGNIKLGVVAVASSASDAQVRVLWNGCC